MALSSLSLVATPRLLLPLLARSLLSRFLLAVLVLVPDLPGHLVHLVLAMVFCPPHAPLDHPPSVLLSALVALFNLSQSLSPLSQLPR